MRSLFGSVMIVMALLGLTAAPNIAYGQEKGDKAKPAKTEKDKPAKGAEAPKASGDKAAAGDEASRLERLQQALGQKLKLTPDQKTKIDQLFASQKKAAEAAAKAREAFQAQHGAKLEELNKQIEAAKKAGDTAKVESLGAERSQLMEMRSKATDDIAGAKQSELFAAVDKLLQPEQKTQFKALLVELKLVADENAGSSLDLKDVMKAVMSRDVGVDESDKEAISTLFKQKAAEIKTAKGDKAKIAQIKTALRSELAAKLGAERWQAALNVMADMEKKSGKDAKDAPSKAAPDGKAKPDAGKSKDDGKKKGKKDKK